MRLTGTRSMLNEKKKLQKRFFLIMKAPTQHDQIMIMIQKKLKQGMHKTEARQMLRKHVFFFCVPCQHIALYKENRNNKVHCIVRK